VSLVISISLALLSYFGVARWLAIEELALLFRKDLDPAGGDRIPESPVE
jgi:hypothetical protein